jgi:hypothetical protein
MRVTAAVGQAEVDHRRQELTILKRLHGRSRKRAPMQTLHFSHFSHHKSLWLE